MRPPMPRVDGVEHLRLDLPTGVRVHVAAAGPADAPAILALHGWPQHWWSWRKVIPRLAGDLRVLCPDLRGFGWSSEPADGDYVKERLADDALALLDALGLERACLVGHDWGGWAAILAALRAPQRFTSLVALSTGHPWTSRALATRNAWRFAYQLPLAAPLVRTGWLARIVLEMAPRAPGEVATYLDALPAGATARLYRSFLLRETPAAVAGGFRGRRLTVPALLLHGERDPLGTWLVRDFPGQVELVPGAGHFLPEEAPELVAERIRRVAPGRKSTAAG